LLGQGERATIKPGPGHYKLPNLADRRGGTLRLSGIQSLDEKFSLNVIEGYYHYIYTYIIYHIGISIDPDWKLQDDSNLLHKLVWQGVTKKIGPYENSWNYTVGYPIA
jgi:hypothetical protein